MLLWQKARTNAALACTVKAHLPLHRLLGQLRHGGRQQLRPHLLAAGRQLEGQGPNVAVAEPQVPLTCGGARAEDLCTANSESWRLGAAEQGLRVAQRAQ